MTKGVVLSGAGDSEPLKVPSSLVIVIADDDPDMVSTLAMILRDEGHDVRGFQSGRAVMPAVIQLDPDVVVLDINLPEVSGWQLASTIRARHTPKRPLLIGMSGVFTKGPDQVLAQINGFDYYLLKPCDPGALLALIAQAAVLPQGEPTGSRPARKERRVPLLAIERDTYRAALVWAAELVGGAVPLSHRLDVRMADLTHWMAGDGQPPMAVFLAVVDLLVEKGRKPDPGSGKAPNDQ
jgi:DNA-binding response OmpR family regulator